jgi:hypothetical protein
MTWRGYELTDPPMHDDPNTAGPNKDAINLIRHKLHDKVAVGAR